MKENTRRREKRVTYSKKSGASRRRKRGRELAEPHFVSLDLVSVHVLSDSYVQLHTKSRYIPLGVQNTMECELRFEHRLFAEIRLRITIHE
jgi:hypothetical protein